jgi:uncharacterized protein (DUF2062 family)
MQFHRQIKEFIHKVKEHFHHTVKSEHSPHSIALGFAIGTFCEIIIPVPGVNVLLVLIALAIYPKTNKLSLLLAVLFWNSLFTIPLYALGYELGNMIFGTVPVIEFNIPLYDRIFNFSRRFLVGTFIITTALSVLCYILIRILMQLYQDRKKRTR